MRALRPLCLLLAITACQGPEPVAAPEPPSADATPEASPRIGAAATGGPPTSVGHLLPTPSRGRSAAEAVNRSGTIVGWVTETHDDWRVEGRPAVWPTLAHRIDIDLGGHAGRATEISDGGDVAGELWTIRDGLLTTFLHWVRRVGGPVLVLPPTQRIAGMNAAGTLLINNTVAGGNELLLLTRAGTRRVVGSRIGIALSDAGDILAREGTTYGIQSPNGTWTPLQVPTQGCRLKLGAPTIEAHDINSHRDVVGGTHCPGGIIGADLYAPTARYFTTWDASGAATVHLLTGIAGISVPGAGFAGGLGAQINDRRVAALQYGDSYADSFATLLSIATSPPTLSRTSRGSGERGLHMATGLSSGVNYLVGYTRHFGDTYATVWVY